MCNVVDFEARRRERERQMWGTRFGGCPQCGGTDGYLNVGPFHWFICDQHRTRWLPAHNLFADWRDESEDIWEANRQKLAEYHWVDREPGGAA